MPANKSKATSAEREVLDILWASGEPLTSSEIVKCSPNKTWKPSYIHLMITSLLKKELIQVAGFKKTTKNYARTFAPTMSKQQLLFEEMLPEDTRNDDNSLLLLMEYALSQVNEKSTIDQIITLCEQYKNKL